ncbi:MAG TPA: hypothetical protein VGM34_00730 [Chlamydiales bacterium]
MKIATQLPQEWQNLAALDARIASGNLSFEELQMVSDELAPLFYSTSAKVKELAKKIFETIFELKQRLLEKDLGLVAELQQLEGKIEALHLRGGDLSPEEMAEELVALDKEFFKLQIPTASRLRTKYKALGEGIEKLQFGFVFPVVAELEVGEMSFAGEIFRIAEQLEQSPKALDALTCTQKKEILNLAGNGQGMSAEGLVHAAEGYVESLRYQAEVARAFFSGRVDEGFQALLDLPEATRIQIDEFIWEAAGEAPIDPTLPESHSLMASAVLQSMEERMGFSD